MRRKKNAFKKAHHAPVTQKTLDERTNWALGRGYSKARWVEFCEKLMASGLSLRLYEAWQTLSKYITVSDGDRSYKVRFSNHRPIKSREMGGDCDFFVGVTHTGSRTAEDALRAVAVHFDRDIEEIQA